MKKVRIRTLSTARALAWALIGVALTITAARSQDTPQAAQPAAKPAPQERIDAMKKSFADSQALLRKYEWIETTVTSHKGEEKSRVVKRCYYGAERALQKVLVTAPPKEKRGFGIRGRVKAKKKKGLIAYMESAAALVEKYLPPTPAKIQASKDAGKASIHMIDPGKRARIQLRDYLQPGDSLSFDLDLVKNRLLGLSVASVLGESKDPVTLNVRLATFPDGTIYTAQATLDAKAKSVKVTVENTGYRKLAQ